MPGAPETSILAVTDDLIFRSRIQAALSAAGFPVRFVGGSRLLEEAKRSRPSLILVDYFLCGEAGFEAIAALKQDDRTRTIPILAYGPHLDLAGRDRARAAGADDLLANSQIAAGLPDLARRWTAGAAGRDESRPGQGAAR